MKYSYILYKSSSATYMTAGASGLVTLVRDTRSPNSRAPRWVCWCSGWLPLAGSPHSSWDKRHWHSGTCWEANGVSAVALQQQHMFFTK